MGRWHSQGRRIKVRSGAFADAAPHPGTFINLGVPLGLRRLMGVPWKQPVADEDAFVTQYWGVVKHVVMTRYRRFIRSTYPQLDDLFQEGCIGLIRAVRTYDPARLTRDGVPFSKLTWAMRNVIWAIKWSLAGARRTNRIESLRISSTFWDDGEEIDRIVMAEALPQVSELILDDGLHNALEALRLRDPRAHDVVLRRLAGETLQEIGPTYGLTRERIRQIEERALALMRFLMQGGVLTSKEAGKLMAKRRDAWITRKKWTSRKTAQAP